MIFVDTGGWYASSVREEINYPAAVQWLRQNRQPLLTTDFVVDETLTLMRARKQETVAQLIGSQFFDGGLAQIYYLTEEDIRQTWQVFTRFADKEWSFTDCSSKVVMEKLGIAQAFAFDRHFRQFGMVSVVP